MSEEITTEEPGGSGTQDDQPEENPKDQRRRKALSERAQKAEAEAKALKAQLAEVSSQMEEMKDQLDGKHGSIEKIVERKDKEIARLKADHDSLMSEFDNFKTSARRDKFVSALHAEFPDVPLPRLEGLLFVAQSKDSTFDPAPEEVDKHVITSTAKLLKQLDPTFDATKPAETGKARPRPGPAPREHTDHLSSGERALTALQRNLADSPITKPKDDRPF